MGDDTCIVLENCLYSRVAVDVWMASTKNAGIHQPYVTDTFYLNFNFPASAPC